MYIYHISKKQMPEPFGILDRLYFKYIQIFRTKEAFLLPEDVLKNK